MDLEINYHLLADAISYYKSLGYTYVDVPWKVPMHIQRLTYPFLAGEDAKKKMVGSAEQSFLWLDLEGKLPKGRFVACTPCYRKEIIYDELHQPYFMKVELYQNNKNDLSDVLDDAYNFMKKQIPMQTSLNPKQTADGYDLELNGIEVGSYGVRTVANGHSWVYGTGLAEPRFSIALKKV